MKKLISLCTLAVIFAAGPQFVFAQAPKAAYSFGDFRSATLATKGWGALEAKDLDAVLAYTNKCIDMYGEQARKMQADLKELPAGDDQKIFSFWALNDVATCLFIQGKAYRQAGKKDEAKAAFESIVKNYPFGQCYDVGKKIFWKPADAAKDELMMIEKGLDLDFGDMSSMQIVGKAWAASAKKDLEAVKVYVAKVEDLYGQRAKDMQASLKEFPWESTEKIHSFWALNDVGTANFILGQTYRNAGMKAEAIAAFKKLVDNYGYSQCWDPQGWFWKPAEAAQQQIIELEAQK
ncbi:MAG: tetratricopeptide repeat protein [Candidatus Omnitrophica bacterium]|nr:tetratricopeptide repeat protein [Candidatus Omnitrophota bacterium]